MRPTVSRFLRLLALPLLLAALAAPASAQVSRVDFATGITSPGSMVQLADGRILVVERGLNRVSALNPATGARSDYATGLRSPFALLRLADGRVLVSEEESGPVYNSRLSVITNGTRSDFATGLANPRGLVQLSDGRILVSEPNVARISAVDPATGARSTFMTGVAAYDLVQLGDGRILAAELNNERVSVITNGTRSDFATGLMRPGYLTQLADGRILVTENWVSQGVERVSNITSGTRRDYATGLHGPSDIIQLTDGRILVGENTTQVVSRFVDSTPGPHYVYVSTPRSYAEAEADAIRRGGHLASISTPGENEIVRRRAGGNGSALWIGFDDRAAEGMFAWTDGTPATYTNWNGGEPNDFPPGEDCVEMLLSSGGWNDNACTNLLPYVVEIPASTPTRYVLVTSALSFNDAQADAVARRGWLASVTDAADQAAVRAAANGSDAWIGFTDQDGYSSEGAFVWTDGTPVAYTNWNGGEPNDAGAGEDCTVLTGGGGWNDDNCAGTRAYVLEIPTDLPPVPLVVDTNADDQPYDAAASLVSCTDGASDGDCTLREAIQVANANDSYKLITFDITSGLDANGVATIIAPERLQIISPDVVIDGYTQPGAAVATATTPARIRIQLFGSATPGETATSWGIIAGTNFTLRGLSIGRYLGAVQMFAAGGVVEGNHIGVDALGTTAVANVSYGVDVAASGGRIGTNGDGINDAAERNVISGTLSGGGYGIHIRSTTANTIVAGNYVGTDATGTVGVPNIIGIQINSGTHRIGSNGDGQNDAAEANLIAFNSGVGIRLGQSSVGSYVPATTVFGNAVHSNGGLGIDLSRGNGPNDAGDADTGPNGLQNYPVLTSASPSSVAFTLNSKPERTYRVEFFASAAADPTGYGEGQRYLGFVNADVDGAGNASGTFTPAQPLAAGEFVTATATPVLVNGSGHVIGFPDATDRTSEFSLAVAVAAGTPFTVTGTEGWRTLALPYEDLPLGGRGPGYLTNMSTAGYKGADRDQRNVRGEATVFLYDEPTGAFAPPASETSVEPGQGMWVYVSDVGDPFPGTTIQPGFPKTLDVSGGTEVTTPVSLLVTYTASAPTGPLPGGGGDYPGPGVNLVGNPYPEAIDWNHPSWTKTNISSTVYVWDPAYNNGDYRSWDGTMGDLAGGIIPAGQGFHVRATSENPELVVTPDARTGEPGVIYGKDAPAPRGVSFRLAGTVGERERETGAWLSLSDEATLGLDARDGLRLAGAPGASALRLYTVVPEGHEGEGSALAIGSVPGDLGGPVEIPLHAEALAGGSASAASATLSWEASLPEGWTAVLRDRETGAAYDLAEAGELTLALGSALTVTEADQIPAWQKAAGDVPAMPGVPRGLRAEGASARFAVVLSPSATAAKAPVAFAVGEVYPNPATREARFSLSLPEAGEVAVSVFDALGRRVLEATEAGAAGTGAVRVPVEALAAGTYVVRVEAAGESVTRRLVVVR